MTLVVFLLACNCLLIAGFLRHRHLSRRPGAPPPPKRLTPAELVRFGFRQLLLTAVLLVTFVNGTWTSQSVGIPRPVNWSETILAGELGFAAVIAANFVLLWATRTFQVTRMVAMRGNLRVWPRGRLEKWLAVLFIMGFNPFVEELVMRGVLIHQWGQLLGSPVIPIAVGLVLNGALHWYQGARMQLWHGLFFAVAVTLLYSPWGLPAAMVAHVFGDVLPLLTLGRVVRRIRKARQRERRAAAA